MHLNNKSSNRLRVKKRGADYFSHEQKSIILSQSLQQTIAIAATDGDLMTCYGEGDLLNLGDMVDVDDVALVDADELVAGQLVLERLEAVECGDALLLGVERHILVLPFDVMDVVEVDLVELVVGLHHQVGWV